MLARKSRQLLHAITCGWQWHPGMNNATNPAITAAFIILADDQLNGAPREFSRMKFLWTFYAPNFLMLIRVDNRTFSDWPRTLAVYTLKSIPPRGGTGTAYSCRIQHESIDTPGSPELPVVFKTGMQHAEALLHSMELWHLHSEFKLRQAQKLTNINGPCWFEHIAHVTVKACMHASYILSVLKRSLILCNYGCMRIWHASYISCMDW